MSNEAEFLFDHFRQNLNLVRADPRVKMQPDRDDIVICPLCFNKLFTIDDVKEGQLQKGEVLN